MIFIFEQCIPVVFINNHKYKCIFGIYCLTQLAKDSLKVFITLYATCFGLTIIVFIAPPSIEA
jgi:hypothetical protein